MYQLIVGRCDILPEYAKDWNLLDEIELRETVVEEYWVQKPFIKAIVAKRKDELGNYCYILEPTTSLKKAQIIPSMYTDLKRVLVLYDVSVDMHRW